jgi:DNA-binding response OmpR family regulator
VNADLHVVRDGRSAMQFFDTVDAGGSAPCPTLVLLDLNLPGKSGAQVLKHLRDNSVKCRDVAVLIVTSSDSARDREPVAALGVAAYFRKPSDFGEFMKLGAIVQGLLDR